MPTAHFTGRHKAKPETENIVKEKFTAAKKSYPAQFFIFLGYNEIEMH